MKYWAPINSPGGINGNDSYINANPAAGIQGSVPTFHSFEQTLRGLQNLILRSRMTPNAALDDLQIAEAIRSQALNWTQTYGGTANDLTATFDPALTSLAAIAGMPIRGIAKLTNTGAMTLAAGSLPIRPIVNARGTAMQPGDVLKDLIYECLYNPTIDKYVLVTPLGAGGAGTNGGVFNKIKQPAIFAITTALAPENVGFSPGGWTILPGTNLGDAVFNTSNGNFQVGTNTWGTYSWSVASIPITTLEHNSYNITAYCSNPIYSARSGIALSNSVMMDWDGGYSTHISLGGVIHLAAAGQIIINTQSSLHASYQLITIAGMRIAGGPTS